MDLPKDKIAEVCRRHGVTRLELFGSALSDRFNAKSDYDFFVEYGPSHERSLDAYCDLKDDLERLLGRDVDLIERAAIRNRFFRIFTRDVGITIYAA